MHSTTLNALQHRMLDFRQEENAAVTYVVNWAAFLDGDTISTSSWSTEDGSLTIANEANTTTTASCRLSGDVGKYRAVNKIVTAAGDTHERYIDLAIRDNTSGYAYDYGLVVDGRDW